jgi:divinyl protochlorophyllide a 8-vinyl-reductase
LTAAAGAIGPNALLQLIPVLERAIGAGARADLFQVGGLAEIPLDRMIPEAPVARVHQALRARLPDRAPALLREAGLATGDYILANRIPSKAQGLLRHLPAPLARRLLTAAIARHAWTFAGTGRFRVVQHRPLVVEIADNPIVRDETAPRPVCDWHAAVFERLFATLVDPRVTVTETACCACGAPACRFELRFS